MIVFHDTTVFHGVRRLVRKEFFRSRQVKCLGLVSSIVYGKKAEYLAIGDRIYNYYLLFWHSLYSGLSSVLLFFRPPLWSIKLAKSFFSSIPFINVGSKSIKA